jgi:uncharacterized protein involved in response to NO
MTRVLLNVQEPRTGFQGPVMLASGHRPFFLMAGLYGATALPLWLAAYFGYLPLTASWHGHEMIFGFAVAAIAGFLMAAVPKWTNSTGIAGWPLVLLIALWLAGRLSMLVGEAVFIDLLFLPVLATFVLADIARARNARNYQVAGILFVLAVFDALYHFYDPSLALRVSTLMIVALIALIGGRIIPAFTQNALRMKHGAHITCHTPRVLDWLAVPSVIMVVVVELLLPQSAQAGVASLVAGIILFLRMFGWQTRRTLRMPLVWILHVGYAWVPLGFVLNGLVDLGAPVNPSAAFHALTAGAIGVMILAVASRAALGHSGRPLEPSAWTVVAYGLVIAAAIVRVFVPLDGSVLLAGVLWFLGYAIFSAVYWPILTKPRIDGLPG